MALFYKCGFRKIVAGIPVLVAITLIIYISLVFNYSYLPAEYPDFDFVRVLIQIPFTWFSLMTLLSIIRTCMSDPGYLSPEY